MVCQSYCLSTSAKIRLPLHDSEVDVRCVQVPVVGHTLLMTPIWIINRTVSWSSRCNKSNLNQFQSPRVYWIRGEMGSGQFQTGCCVNRTFLTCVYLNTGRRQTGNVFVSACAVWSNRNALSERPWDWSYVNVCTLRAASQLSQVL